MSIELMNRARRSAVALTRCYRWALADGSPPCDRPTPALLRALRRLDSALEFYWHPIRKRWILYRVAQRGVVRSEDTLVKELELVGPHGEYRAPGMWLIHWLEAHDVTRGGSIHPGYAHKHYINDLMRANERLDEENDAQCSDVSLQCAKNMEKYAVRELKHYDMKVH